MPSTPCRTCTTSQRCRRGNAKVAESPGLCPVRPLALPRERKENGSSSHRRRPAIPAGHLQHDAFFLPLIAPDGIRKAIAHCLRPLPEGEFVSKHSVQHDGVSRLQFFNEDEIPL